MCTARVNDGCTDESSIAQLFVNKYRSIYSCVSHYDTEMRGILADLEAQVSNEGLRTSNHNVHTC